MVVLLTLFAFASVATHDASAKKKAKPAKVTLSVTTKNQAALLKAKKVTVRVRSTGKATVSLSAGKNFKTAKAKFKKKKKQTKTINLALTSAGKAALAKCAAQKVSVSGKYKKGKKKATAKAKKTLAKDTSNSNCTITPPPNPPVTPERSTCDPLDTKVCMQPWPSNFYTKAANTPTGLQLDIPAAAMPKNIAGTPIDPTDINRNDGFSPGNLIVTKIPEVQTPAAFNNSGIVSATTMNTYTDPNQAIVVFDAATGERQPIYAELDSNPTTKPVQTFTPGQPPVDIIGGHPNDNPGNTADVNMYIRPAKNFTPGHRYIVAIRNLKDASNAAVQPAAAFKQCRDDAAGITDAALKYRCNEIEKSVFPDLSKAGVTKDNLYLAWDFTVASQQSLTGRATTIRDDAFKRLGDTDLADRKITGSAPEMHVTAFCDLGNPATALCGNNSDPTSATPQAPVPNGTYEQRTVRGYLTVPCYLNQDGCPTGSSFDFDSSGNITWHTNYKMNVPFLCLIPRSTTAGGVVHPGGTGTYGHGLLGDLGQVRSSGSTREVANENNSTWCGANWDGFSTPDFGTVAASLKDLSNFNKLTDRMVQGFVNFMMVQRALAHPNGFATLPAFNMTFDGTNALATPGSAIDTSAGADTRGYYYGISQGGIMGSALTALSPDVDRGALGVPGINYSTLLSRSVDFDEYANGDINDTYLQGVGLYENYPNKAELPVIFSIMQLLWDKGEGDGYAQVLNPNNPNLPNTNRHTVLMEPAVGDHQVANIAAEVEARTIGAKSYSPDHNVGRTWTGQGFGIAPFTAPLANAGNVMMYFDGGPIGFSGSKGAGSAVAPVENVPPRPQWGYGGDPHSYPRVAPDGYKNVASYLKTGNITACSEAGEPCYSNGYTGP